jgi:hypothetical protein
MVVANRFFSSQGVVPISQNDLNPPKTDKEDCLTNDTQQYFFFD